MNNFFIDEKVSNKALNAFFRRNSPSGEVHALHVLHHGRTVVRFAVPPYRIEDKRESYSLSKSFTSTAIGLLVSEGKLTLDARIAHIFPDKIPLDPAPQFLRMTVLNVISMNTGHGRCVMHEMNLADDPVKAFFGIRPEYEPGTHFTYNTGASALLACIVERLTGMRLLDYLNEKLFGPLGIEGVGWMTMKGGQAQGGTGIQVSCDDIAKLGQLYLNGGVWNGRRILDQKWTEDVHIPVSDTSMIYPSPDWQEGYGLHFWKNHREGYRGDGAFGQLCVILPEHDMVFAVQGMIGDMQGEMESVYDLADGLYGADEEKLFIPAYMPVSSPADDLSLWSEKRTFGLKDNPYGFRKVEIRPVESESVELVFSCEDGDISIKAGNGIWVRNFIRAQKFKPYLPNEMCTDRKLDCDFSASYRIKPDTAEFVFRFHNCPHTAAWKFSTDDRKLNVDIGSPDFIDRGCEHIEGEEL